MGRYSALKPTVWQWFGTQLTLSLSHPHPCSATPNTSPVLFGTLFSPTLYFSAYLSHFLKGSYWLWTKRGWWCFIIQPAVPRHCTPIELALNQEHQCSVAGCDLASFQIWYQHIIHKIIDLLRTCVAVILSHFSASGAVYPRPAF